MTNPRYHWQMPKICSNHYFLITEGLKRSQNVRLEGQIKANVFVIFLERATVKKEEKDYAKKRNDGLRGHNTNSNTIGILPYSNKLIFMQFGSQYLLVGALKSNCFENL